MNVQSAAHPSPALVLNADFRPLSYFPLSLWSWQDAVKAVFLDRVNILSEYDHVVRSPSFEMKLPSVIALKEFVPQSRRPAFTRFNVFLRDRFSCQYCGARFPTHDLTFDHVVPRSRGGRTSWLKLGAARNILFHEKQCIRNNIYILSISCNRFRRNLASVFGQLNDLLLGPRGFRPEGAR
ncbi:MAG: HNH endonuclease [Nisaea sp.]|uniref:HNH endonuclease n=1 Tax=Nisaea sp. TaxID=2024842 RepID=UPI001B11D190|nr:HNH endonuclease [Nisaea sp.]MBO6560118.1 HNH endonuclease [Nisaea sp.]